jgi:hypothetical protein
MVALAAHGLAVWVGRANGVASSLGAVDRVTVTNSGSLVSATLMPATSLPWVKHIVPIAIAAAVPTTADSVLTLPMMLPIVLDPIVSPIEGDSLPIRRKTVEVTGTTLHAKHDVRH